MRIFLNKKNIKYIVCYAVVAIIFAFMALPVVAAIDSGSYQDGSTEPENVRWQHIREYRQQSNDLQQKITALSDTASASVFMPILFGVGIKDISPNFGVLRPSGLTHKGEDIMALKGTPIVSPTAAIVIRTDYGAGEGNAVYTANPGGETFVYYHLDRIGEGVVSGLVLGQGSLIGYVGNTGNASGGAAHLHFEIHDSSGALLDPFLRLTGEFSIQEKILYLSTILTQSSDSVALSRLLVTNFRGIFTIALAVNIALPTTIIDALAFIPETPVPVSAEKPLSANDFGIGSSGAKIVELQKYLIQSASGIMATRLAGAGATGYFGPITKAALVEYQTAVGISPSNGYYGPTTRSYITAHPLGISKPPVSTNPVANSSTVAITRNLYRGTSGEDVRTLQKLLNTNGYTVALTGYGSPGNETIYFGSATEAAVIKFQIAQGILPAVGYVGPLTRAALASL